MKDFLKFTAATILGLFVFGILVTAMGVMSLVGMMASGQQTSSLDDGSVLVLPLNSALAEQGDESIIAKLQGQTTVGLRELLLAVDKAKKSDKVKGIYLDCGSTSADMAQLQELRDALADFKKSGKWIVAYGDSYSQGAYYVASVANKVLLNPVGSVSWHGAGGISVHYKGLLDKLGVKVVQVKVGKYKSMPEMFTEDHMSEPSREQTERYVQGYWNEMVTAVGKSRGITADSLNAWADRVVDLDDAQSVLKRKLVDQLAYADEVKPLVKKMLEIGEDESVPQVSVDQMCQAPEDREGEEVAVYYAYGSIVQSDGDISLSQGHKIVAQDVCRDLQDLADDDDVKAVVVRVNSGGGSAYASEQLYRAIEQLKKKKPVVVSMGGAAASGGYYMSAPASYIFAEPTTITGSIGIFGLFPDVTGLATQKLGLTFDEVKTNRNTTIGELGFTPEQLALMQHNIDRGYMLFKTRVSQGRKMKIERVEELAQGHVYLGSDALKLGLVDELGGLDKAVAKAAKLAKLENCYTISYPGTKDIMDQLMDSQSTTQRGILDEQMRSLLGGIYEPIMMVLSAKEQGGVQASLPFIFKIN